MLDAVKVVYRVVLVAMEFYGPHCLGPNGVVDASERRWRDHVAFVYELQVLSRYHVAKGVETRRNEHRAV